MIKRWKLKKGKILNSLIALVDFSVKKMKIKKYQDTIKRKWKSMNGLPLVHFTLIVENGNNDVHISTIIFKY